MRQVRPGSNGGVEASQKRGVCDVSRPGETTRSDETVDLAGGWENEGNGVSRSQFNDEWQRYLDTDVDGRGSMWLTVLAPAFMLLCILGATAATFGCWLFRRVVTVGN